MSEMQTTVIGKDAKIKGEMTFEQSARILGTFEGKIIAKGDVQVGEGAICRASVDATTVMVDGLIEGDVIARERVELTSKARVKGDLCATALVVADGASFVGHCRVGPEATAAQPETRSEATASQEVEAKTTRGSRPWSNGWSPASNASSNTAGNALTPAAATAAA